MKLARGSMTGVIGPNGSGKFDVVQTSLRHPAARRGARLPSIGRAITGPRPAEEFADSAFARTFQISRLFIGNDGC